MATPNVWSEKVSLERHLSCNLTRSQLTEDLEKVHSRQRQEPKPTEGQTPHVLRKENLHGCGGGRGMGGSDALIVCVMGNP